MKLDLYMFSTCPFCRRVISEINAQGRTDIEMHDIHMNEADRIKLIAVGGKQQVPCLFIDGAPMYESGDIIEWLRANPQAAGDAPACSCNTGDAPAAAGYDGGAPACSINTGDAPGNACIVSFSQEKSGDPDFRISKERIWLEDADGKEIAYVTFPTVDEHLVYVNHTVVDDCLRGQGMAGKLMEQLVDTLRSRNDKAALTCSYAIKWFEKHPECSDVLSDK